MREIRELAAKIVEGARRYADERKAVILPDLDATCPICGAVGLKQIETSYSCHTPKCGLRVGKVVGPAPAQ